MTSLSPSQLPILTGIIIQKNGRNDCNQLENTNDLSFASVVTLLTDFPSRWQLRCENRLCRRGFGRRHNDRGFHAVTLLSTAAVKTDGFSKCFVWNRSSIRAAPTTLMEMRLIQTMQGDVYFRLLPGRRQCRRDSSISPLAYPE